MAEEEPRKKINTYVINQIPRPTCDVEFIPLPFYNTIYTIMVKPVAIYYAPAYKPGLEQPQEHTSFDYEFKLPELIESMINEKKGNLQLQIRFGKELPGMSELSEGLPEPITFYINSHENIAKNSPIDYYCSAFELLNDTKNKITILWPHCKTPYYMMINIVEPIIIEDVVKRIQFNNKLCCTKQRAKAKIIAFLKNAKKKSDAEGCNMGTTLDLSLLCPITKLKMELPARSVKCSHLQCFDLRGLFSLNTIKPTWKCPICNVRILINELFLDSFLLDVLNTPSLPESCSKILFYKNGNWESYIEPKKEINDCNDDDSEPMLTN
ncbi:E3 SUMO-protein ligase pli1 [Acyrthosiphon pisum]|uniref:SP-RING-type domain-containing protein n=1 Tax=Acyrthosiphon pisum TaxID=7029 RepID=A0A8R2H4V3_ACYPI|nr:E3 SUMO-protein ligase pli1 [Acyrthosiphon pisum]|eukprot:XP_016658653.1 PREDICTED: E3 SUMO-protein ligase pli1-like isoform X2 [Acyrthosiphon pisum]